MDQVEIQFVGSVCEPRQAAGHAVGARAAAAAATHTWRLGRNMKYENNNNTS